LAEASFFLRTIAFSDHGRESDSMHVVGNIDLLGLLALDDVPALPGIRIAMDIKRKRPAMLTWTICSSSRRRTRRRETPASTQR
jgi:hypothetical protein